MSGTDTGFKPFQGFKLAICAYAAIWGTGFLSYTAMPYLIGSIADGMGLDESQAGLIGSAELLVVALSAFAVSARMKVLPRRRVAQIGAVIAIAGHALSPLPNSVEILLPARGLAGVGAGMALAIGNARIPAAPDPAKAYGQVMMLLATVTAAVIVSLGYITAIWSYYGLFGAQAFIVLFMLVPISFLPEGDETRSEDDTSADKVEMLPAATIVVGILLWHYCDNSIWGFSERIATNLGMEAGVIGWLLGAGLLIGVLGGFVASGLGTRYGRIWPMVLGVAVAFTSIWVITSTGTIPPYTASILVYIVSFMFISSYIYGLAGELDPHGRVMAVASGAGNLGVALAPLISGRLIGAGGYELMGNVVLVTLVIVLALSVMVGRHINLRLSDSRAASGAPLET